MSVTDASTPRVRRWRSTKPLDVLTTLSVFGRGRHDPVHRMDGQNVWRTAHTPEGPVTMCATQDGDRGVEVRAWGAGAQWQLEVVPALFGETTLADSSDHLDGASHAVIRDAYRRNRGLRVPGTGLVFEALVFVVLEQKVVGLDAMAARRRLVKEFGSPAATDAPAGMMVSPNAEGWRMVPSWSWHQAGVDPKRSRTIVSCARYASRIEQASAMTTPDARARLLALPGIGEWSYAEIAKTALGDTDAVSVGDYHLGRFVTWALTGKEDGTDDDMLELLEPYRPHRQIVVRLLELTKFGAMPRRGPRMSRIDYRKI